MGCERGSNDWGGLQFPSRSEDPQQQGLKRDRDSHSSEESELSTMPAAAVVGDDGDLSAGIAHPAINHCQRQHQQHQQHLRVSFADSGGHYEVSASRSSSSVTRSATCTPQGTTSTLAGGAHGNGSTSNSVRRSLTVCVDGGGSIGRNDGLTANVNPLRSPSSGVRLPPMAMVAEVGGASLSSRVSCC